MKVEELISEMEKLKGEYPSLEKSEILKIFEIQANMVLAKEIAALRLK